MHELACGDDLRFAMSMQKEGKKGYQSKGNDKQKITHATFYEVHRCDVTHRKVVNSKNERILHRLTHGPTVCVGRILRLK